MRDTLSVPKDPVHGTTGVGLSGANYKVFAFIVHIVFFILSVVVCGIDVINVLVSGPELNLRSRNETLVEYGPFCPIRMHAHVT